MMRNSTNDFLDSRAPVFVISFIEGLGIVILNTVLLAVSCKIKKEIRNQLHIFYTFLGVSDLLNGSMLLVSSFTYFYKDFYLFHNYKICYSIALFALTQMFITGYLLLLLTFVKCFSIITPLKCLKYVTREMAIGLSVGVWIFTTGLVIIPSLVWIQNKVYSSRQECDPHEVYGDKVVHFITLRKSAMGIFIFSLIILNSMIVMKIIKRNRRIGVLKGKLDTSIYKPDIKGVLGNKMDTCSSVAGMSVGEPGIKGFLEKKVETRTSIDEPGHNTFWKSKLDTWSNVAEPGTSRVMESKLDTSSLVDKPDNNGILKSKPHINELLEGKLDTMSKMSVLKPGSSGGLTTKMDTSSTVDELGTSHTICNTNNIEHLSVPKRKITKSQVNTKDHDQIRKTTTKQRLKGTKTYNFMKSKNFKAYLTVLMHVGFHLLSGLPAFVFSSNGQLLSYYTNSRSIRFICAMCRYFVSLIDPILILLRIPVFRTTLKTLCSKCIQRQPKYY